MFAFDPSNVVVFKFDFTLIELDFFYIGWLEFGLNIVLDGLEVL